MKQPNIEAAIKAYISEELTNRGYNYSLENFILDVDEPYRAAILDFSVSYTRLGEKVGNSGFFCCINYVVSLQVPLSATTEEEARLESMHIQHGIVEALLKLERCQPVMRLEQINFLKSVVQDKYRSIEKPGALMLEILASFELEYQEQFYV